MGFKFLLVNRQIEKRLVSMLGPSDRVLDVGGWYAPFNRATHVIDLMPYETRNRAGAIHCDRWPSEHFSRETYFELDICGPDPWPFEDKYFDFAICSHTLEDIRDPIFVCRELNRVAKAGYIEVPSRLIESTRGVERPFFCGYYHHRWLCEVEPGAISFQFKPAMLHAYRKFHLRKPWFTRVNPELSTSFFIWEGEFGYSERIIIDRNEVQADLVRFRKAARKIPRRWVSRWSKPSPSDTLFARNYCTSERICVKYGVS